MAEEKRKPKWKTLESNPDVINQFMKGLGVPTKDWAVSDCFSLDPEMLSFVPKPCLSVILLYPTTELKGEKKLQQEQLLSQPPSDSSLYFVKQLVGNACGTIAVVHAIANNLNKIQLEDKALKKFIETTIDKTPLERGELLGYDEGISEAHEISAKKGQTKHDQVDRSDFHFVCFICKDNKIYEMDGGKVMPVNHGPTTPETFLEDTAKVIQREFIAKTKDNFFSILTLGASNGNSQPEIQSPTRTEISQEKLMELVSMGFDIELASEALLMTNNNLERATEILLQ